MRLARIDELHIISQDLYIQAQALQTKQMQISFLTDALYDLMILAYVYGSNRVDGSVPQNPEKLYKALYKQIAGENFEERIAKHVQEETLSQEALERIVDTDWHRMEETGAFDTAEEVQRNTGKSAYKVWNTMLDDRVRDTHRYLESTAVPLNARFYTYDDDSALYPGDFEKPENNIGCRCEISYTFR